MSTQTMQVQDNGDGTCTVTFTGVPLVAYVPPTPVNPPPPPPPPAGDTGTAGPGERNPDGTTDQSGAFDPASS